MKQKLIKAGVLSIVFVVALILSSVITNNDSVELTTIMSEASLPTVSFESEGYGMNRLVGYMNEMEIPAMRDTITPLDKDGAVSFHIQTYDNVVQKVTYQVYSLDGERMLMEKSESYNGEALTITPGTVLSEDVEAVLCISLDIKEKEPAYYYTRIVRPVDFHVKECLDFTKKLHKFMIEKDRDSMAFYMEPSPDADTGTLQHVTITSSVEQATWGSMEPKIVGDLLWDIKETNETYTSVLLKYNISNQIEGVESLYMVEEFFKVRKLGEKYYLLVYDRTMEELFDSDKEVLTSKGVDLGVASGEQQYAVGKDGELVAFAIQRELWCYDRAEDSLSQVFAFRSGDSADQREEYNQHDIRIVSMDKDGNITFMVYGYMNRGSHEGEVGVAVYYYNHNYNTVTEKAFLASDKSFAVAAEELCKMVYYNEGSDSLYLLTEGKLRLVSTETEEETMIAEGLSGEQYVLSEDGKFFAYQKGGDVLSSEEIVVLNMETGKSHSIMAESGNYIRPLGFIGADFVYGTLRSSDRGKTVSGTATTPMYRMDICDEKYEVVKTYQEGGIFISDVLAEDNMLTLKRVKKNGKKYREIAEEYITNNEENVDNNISLSPYTGTGEGRQYLLAFADGIDDKKPKILRGKQILVDDLYTRTFESNVAEDRYYVYGAGRLIGVFHKAGYAIQEANAREGVVVSSNQTYVWERGNYDAWYQIYDFRGMRKKKKETSLEACIRLIGEYEGGSDISAAGMEPMDALNQYSGGEALDLTGCATSELCYMVSQGTPVIAMTGETSAVLLIGYYNNTIVYLDPADGITRTCSYKAMDDKTEATGYTFLGYAKAQEYE